MKEVSLDALIKQDKQKAKAQRKNKNNNQKKIKRPNTNQKDVGGRFQNSQPRRFNKNKFGNKNNFQTRENQPFVNRATNRLKRRTFPPKQIQKPQGNKQKGRTLQVLGLHPDFNNEDLYKLFSAHGALEKCLRENDNFGRQLPTALVKYHSADSATKAIENLNQHKVMNSVLTVQPYKRNTQ